MSSADKKVASVSEASNVPLPCTNYVALLQAQRKRIVDALGGEGFERTIRRALVKLLRLLSYVPRRRQADGAALTSWAFICQTIAARVLGELHHRLRGHGCHRHFEQMVQQLSRHVLKAVARQLQRAEVQKALSERRCPVDLQLVTLISVSLLATPNGEFNLQEHLPLLQSAQPDLQAEDVAEIILQSTNASKTAVYKVLRHLALNAIDAWTEEAEVFAVSCVCTYGFQRLHGRQATELLFLAAHRQRWLKAACLLVLAASRDHHRLQVAVEVYEGSEKLLQEVEPRLPQLYDSFRVVCILHEVLRIARLVHEHLRKGELYDPFDSDPEPEQEEAGWLRRPPTAVAPGPSSLLRQPPAHTEFRVADLDRTRWRALGVPDHAIFDFVSQRWHFLKPHQQSDLLHTLADYIVTGFYFYSKYEIVQLELAALQVLIHFGPDCLNAAQLLELLIICSTLPALQARYAAAWVRLSPRRRLLLPRLLQMLPTCRKGRPEADAFLELLPAATTAALDAFLQHAHSAVPESACRPVDFKSDGVGGHNFVLRHSLIRNLVWRTAYGFEKHKVHSFVAALVEEPDVAGLSTRSAFLTAMDHSSVLQTASQLLDDETLLEETVKCLPLLEEDEDARCLLTNLAFRAADLLLRPEGESQLPSEAFGLLLEHSHLFGKCPVRHLELLVLACEDVFKQAQLLTLWTCLSDERRAFTETAKKFWAATAKFQKPSSSDAFNNYVKSIAPEELISVDECLESYAAFSDRPFPAATFRQAMRNLVWQRNDEDATYRPKILEGHPEEEDEPTPEGGLQLILVLQEDASEPPSLQEVVLHEEKTPAKKQTAPDASDLVPTKRSTNMVPRVVLHRLTWPVPEVIGPSVTAALNASKKRKITVQGGEAAPKQTEPIPLRRSRRISERHKQVKADVPAPMRAHRQVAKVPVAAEPAILQPRQKNNEKSKQSPAEASGPAAKRPKNSCKVANAAQVVPQPAQRPKRKAAQEAREFIQHCAKNMKLNKKAESWESFEQQNKFLPKCIFVAKEQPRRSRRVPPK